MFIRIHLLQNKLVLTIKNKAVSIWVFCSWNANLSSFTLLVNRFAFYKPPKILSTILKTWWHVFSGCWWNFALALLPYIQSMLKYSRMKGSQNLHCFGLKLWTISAGCAINLGKRYSLLHIQMTLHHNSNEIKCGNTMRKMSPWRVSDWNCFF